MKKIVFFVFFISLFVQDFSFSQCGWQKIQVGLNQTTLISVHFPCSDTGYIVGTRWDIADSNIILRTTNKGLNWTVYQEFIPVTVGTFLHSVYFTSAKTGYAVSCKSSPNYRFGSIIKTTNAGINWFNIYNEPSYLCTLRDVIFLNDNTGYVTCIYPTKYLKTTNAGITWDSVTQIVSNEKIFHFFSLNNNVGFSSGLGDSKFEVTTNGGLTWDNRTSYLNDYTEIGHLFFTDYNIGYAFAFNVNVNLIKTTNSGYNWEVVNNLQTDTLGLYWSHPFFTNSATGYFLGVDWNNTYKSFIFKTTNSGFNFINQLANKNYPELYSIHFINSNTGIAVGNSGTILRTTNGGVSHQISGNVKFQDNNQLVVAGWIKAYHLDAGSGQISVVDSTEVQPDGSYILNNIPELDLYIGAVPNSSPPADYVLTYFPSTIYYQGATVLHPTENLNDVNIRVFRLSSATSSNHINGEINSGVPIIPLGGANIYAKNGNAFVGFASSGSNGVYALNSLPLGNLRIIVNRIGYCSDSTAVNLTSANLDSVNFYLTKVSVGINPISNVVPDKYFLFQNYPNPFNPTTTIKFSIPSLSSTHVLGGNLVTLKVYNILGKEISTLVNENLKAGEYEAIFDANNLPSGIYFYRLIAGDFTNVKKMLIIK
jgi:photosystem II stability/assembly factor-like uncharacterized protein